MRPSASRFRLLVFFVALTSLAFELVLSRLASFHLGANNAYLAIPITFLGLALGSLHVQLQPRIAERFDAAAHLWAMALATFASLTAGQLVFSRIMPLTSELIYADHKAYLLEKTLVFIAVALPPFYVFGRVLAATYYLCRDHIGSIYSVDFAGAALACAAVPIVFHLGGLPTAVAVLLVVALVPAVLLTRRRRPLAALAAVALAATGVILFGLLDSHLDYGSFRHGTINEEIAHRWNEHSRVALIRRHHQGRNDYWYKIVHGSERSNVRVRPYRPERVPTEAKVLDDFTLPWIMGRRPKKILVMFAGCGAEMTSLNELAGGEADITGVELNGLVKDIARDTPELAGYRLREFFALPQIHLVIDEGRHFLETTDEKFDLIVVGTNAATLLQLTGHSRKYLDTVEAFGRYLDRLADGGLIVFQHQPMSKRLLGWRKVFERRGIGDLGARFIALDAPRSNDTFAISPSGFTLEEIKAVAAAGGYSSKKLHYLPRSAFRSRGLRKLAEKPYDASRLITDDRPFLLGLDFAHYRLIPSGKQLSNFYYYLPWIKLTTLLLLTVLSLAFIGLASIRRRSRVPAPVLGFLLITGFAYLLCEIAAIAKLELFLQSPLLSMAAVLSIFLLTSGVGSALFERVGRRLRMSWYSAMVAVLTVATMLLLEQLSAHFLGLPIAVKLLLSALVIAPLGVALGVFYPFAVSALVANDRESAVPITYGISTLASVVGATYAMTMMLEWGFSSLLRQAAIAYAVLAALLAVYRLAGGRLLSLK